MTTNTATEPSSTKSRRRIPVKRFVAAGVLLVATAVAMLVFSQFPDAFFPAYRSFSRAIMGALANATSFVPISIWDFSAVILVVAALFTGLRCLGLQRGLLSWFSTVCVVVAALLAFLVGAWGLNHYAPALSQEIGLDVREYSEAELEQATLYYAGQAATLATQVERDDNYGLVEQDFRELACIAGAAYEPLGSRYEIFAHGSTAPVKELVLGGNMLLYCGSVGIFMPFTGESNVPDGTSTAEKPFTMCHEAAHRLGIASEEEANYAAFLACEASDDVRLRYSGYFNAFVYCFNALADASPERATAVLEQMVGQVESDLDTFGCLLVLLDAGAVSTSYEAYEGDLQEAGTAANNTYLEVFGEEEGVQSYGLVVDYLIAHTNS